MSQVISVIRHVIRKRPREAPQLCTMPSATKNGGRGGKVEGSLGG